MASRPPRRVTRHAPRDPAPRDPAPRDPAPRDAARVATIRHCLETARLDGLVCARPSNVLLLTGYRPVVGTACAVVGPHRTILVAPDDECALARIGWADEIRPFAPAALDHLTTATEAIREPLDRALARAGITHGRVGVEAGSAYEPSSYAGLHHYGAGLVALLRRTGCITPVRVDALLASLRATATPRELARITTACHIAQRAFTSAAPTLCSGLTEVDAASRFRSLLSAEAADPSPTTGPAAAGGATAAADDARAGRADGFAFCMSGANAARAYGAYARSAHKRLEQGELVLIHCNSYADGFWTDITRTYCLGEPDHPQQMMYEAVLAARAAALEAIRPGVRAASIDRAARDALATRGFRAEFKHSTGHGVGFAAIDHTARPRLHPSSPDILDAGMVCNVEPAIYIDGYAGLRHCDVVAVTETGAEVLTPFHTTLEELVLPASTAHPAHMDPNLTRDQQKPAPNATTESGRYSWR